MPIQRCKIHGRPGWKWGSSGKCYAGPSGRAKAERQAAAIRASGWTENLLVNAARPRRGNPLKLDPTRTATLRRKFMSELRGRFRALKRKLFRLIVEEDAFG